VRRSCDATLPAATAVFAPPHPVAPLRTPLNPIPTPTPIQQIVYEFLLRYVVSNDTDAKVAKK